MGREANFDPIKNSQLFSENKNATILNLIEKYDTNQSTS